MLDILIQIGAAKLVVSVVLAGLAWAVQRRVDHPAVAYPLWLLVFVALLLPAVVSIPVLPGESGATRVIADGAAPAGEPKALSPVHNPGHNLAAPGTPFSTWIAENARAGLAIAWLVVTALLLGWTLVRTLRFRRWLARTSQPAPQKLRDEVAEIGRRLNLARMPEVRMTTARLSPMVCWTGGRIRLVMPSFLVAALDRRELRAVLAHELAHVRRRDHLVRWIEWLACSAFWWNPVAWWARRELRAAEEASCDALGVAATMSTPRAYAESLLRVVDVMSKPPTPPTPAFASGVASSGSSNSLDRRLRTLVKGRSTDQTPRWTRATAAAAAACLLPLGLVYCSTDVQTPTALEEPPEPPPVAETEMVVVLGPDGPDSRAAELEELWSGDPEYAYLIFSSGDLDGPHPLADAPVHRAECRLDADEPDQEARDEAMASCARAIADDLPGTGDSVDRNVCVQWGSKASGWRGICEAGEPGKRHLLHGNSTGSFLLERITVFGSEG